VLYGSEYLINMVGKQTQISTSVNIRSIHAEAFVRTHQVPMSANALVVPTVPIQYIYIYIYMKYI